MNSLVRLFLTFLKYLEIYFYAKKFFHVKLKYIQITYIDAQGNIMQIRLDIL